MQIVQEIVSTFSKHIDSYDNCAQIQHHAATVLSKQLPGVVQSVADGPVLEIGCGTGILTRQLLNLLPDRRIVVSDASPDMVSFCRSRLQLEHGSTPPNVKFAVLNGQNIEQPDHYGLIVSSFTLQWFLDLSAGIHNLLSCLKPGGTLLFSLPISGSFPEWQEMCRQSEISCTLNALPKASEIDACAWWHNYQRKLIVEDVTVTYPSALLFFRSLKELGADTNIAAQSNTAADLRRLLKHWDKQYPDGIQITYKILYGSITRSR